MPPKLTSNEESLTKRLAQKIYKRKRYNEIKNDPELLDREKIKRRERYLKQKEALAISNKSLREQRIQRKKWKEYSKRYRQRKKEGSTLDEKELFQTINIQAVVDNDDSDPEDVEASDSKLDDPLPCSSHIQAKVIKSLQDLHDDAQQAEPTNIGNEDLETSDVNEDRDHSRQQLLNDFETHVKTELEAVELDLNPIRRFPQSLSESQSFDSDDLRSLGGDAACANDVKSEARSSCRNDTDSCPAHTRLLEAILSCASRQEQSAARAALAQEAQARALERIARILEEKQKL